MSVENGQEQNALNRLQGAFIQRRVRDIDERIMASIADMEMHRDAIKDSMVVPSKTSGKRG